MAKLTRKKRSVKKTVLIYTEGPDDEIFVKHLRGLYAVDKDLVVTVRTGRGGSADCIVNNASRVLGCFDKRVVVFDNDGISSLLRK